MTVQGPEKKQNPTECHTGGYHRGPASCVGRGLSGSDGPVKMCVAHINRLDALWGGCRNAVVWERGPTPPRPCACGSRIGTWLGTGAAGSSGGGGGAALDREAGGAQGASAAGGRWHSAAAVRGPMRPSACALRWAVWYARPVAAPSPHGTCHGTHGGLAPRR